jgi:hypothetical protein
MFESSAKTNGGWAGQARPPWRALILGALILAFAALLLIAPAARAEPPTPGLTGTTPNSPNTDLSPFVHGNSSGIEIHSVPLLRSGPVRLGTGPREIQLFTNASCQGTPAAVGTPAELDTSGIQVTVEAEQTTLLSANQTEGAEVSGCSAPIEYQQVKELPPPPPPTPPNGGTTAPTGPSNASPPPAPRLRAVPGGIANDNTPLVTGAAPGASSVKIFTNADCDGAPVATGSAAQFAAGVPVRVVDNAAVAFYGVSVGPGGHSRCSDPAFYVEDSLAPHVRITMGPASKTRRHSATFRFTDVNGNLPGTAFFCRVDRGKWRKCGSPLHLHHLRKRRYTVSVKATDAAGNAEKKPAKRRFKVI